MNSSRIAKLVMVVMVAMMTVGSFAHAGDGGKHKGKHGDRIQKVIARLDLTADQQARIKAIHEAFKNENSTTFEQIKALRTQMQDARKNKNQEQAKAIREQIKAKMESLRPARERMIEQMKGVLTAEQRAELEKMMAERKDHRGGKEGKKNGQARKNAPQID